MIADKVFFGSDYPFSAPEEGLELTRAVTEVGEGTNLPRVSADTVETIIHKNPFQHWWHDPMGAGVSA